MEKILAHCVRVTGNTDAVTPLWQTLYDTAHREADKVTKTLVDNVFLLCACLISNMDSDATDVIDALGDSCLRSVCSRTGIKISDAQGQCQNACCCVITSDMQYPSLLALITLANMHLSPSHQLTCKRHFFSFVPDSISWTVMALLQEAVVLPAHISHDMFVSVSTLPFFAQNIGTIMRGISANNSVALLGLIDSLVRCVANLLCVQTSIIFEFVDFLLTVQGDPIVYDLLRTITSGLDIYRLHQLVVHTKYNRHVSSAVFNQVIQRDQSIDWFDVTLGDFETIGEFILYSHTARKRLHTHSISFVYLSWLQQCEQYEWVMSCAGYTGLMRLIEATMLPAEDVRISAGKTP